MEEKSKLLIPLIEILLKKNVISESEVESIRDASSLVKVLSDKGLVTGEEIVELASQRYGFIRDVLCVMKKDPLDRKTLEEFKILYGKDLPEAVDFIEKVMRECQVKGR